MSRRYTFTPEADQDLYSIWERIADEHSDTAADHVLAGILAECDRISEMPGIGHYRENLLNRDYRFWKRWSYLIVYRWQATPIQITAIVHGARDLDTFFSDRPEA